MSSQPAEPSSWLTKRPREGKDTSKGEDTSKSKGDGKGDGKDTSKGDGKDTSKSKGDGKDTSKGDDIVEISSDSSSATLEMPDSVFRQP
jgi:hypothetical protein